MYLSGLRTRNIINSLVQQIKEFRALQLVQGCCLGILHLQIFFNVVILYINWATFSIAHRKAETYKPTSAKSSHNLLYFGSYFIRGKLRLLSTRSQTF